MMHRITLPNRLIADFALLAKYTKKLIGKPQRKYQLKQLINSCKAGDSVIFFFPDYNKHNPHQILLRNAMPAHHHYQSGDIEDALYFQRHASDSVATYFHLHWPDPILPAKQLAQFIDCLRQFRELGGKSIWTIHNAFPHEQRSPSIRDSQRSIAEHVDWLHFFTERELESILSLYNAPAEKSFVAMCGSYIGHYKNECDKTNARQALRLPQDHCIIGFFGQLRPYKGLDKLLDTYTQLAKEHASLGLTFSGWRNPAGGGAISQWRKKAARTANVYLFDEFIADDQVQYHLHAVDILVLPYVDIMNSGSYLLGLSFGCCMVVPNIGMIASLATNGLNSITYDPDDPDGLRNALEYAISLTPEQRATIGANAFKLAQSLSWEDFAQSLCQAFAGLK